MYVYRLTDRLAGVKIWTVGFYSPWGRWHAESDWSRESDAAARASYLNGNVAELKALLARIEQIEATIRELASKAGSEY